jgi:ubiquitin carboxyl-terminal hydrolase 10
MSSCFQSLFHCDRFFQLLRRHSNNKVNKHSCPVLFILSQFSNDFAATPTKLKAKPVLPKRELHDRLIMLWRPELARARRFEQQDAHEFLAFLLNAINDELAQLKKNNDASSSSSSAASSSSSSSGGAEQWQTKTGRGRKCQLVVIDDASSELSDMFGSQIRSTLRERNGRSGGRAQLEPSSLVLSVDIQRDSVRSLGDAIGALMCAEQLELNGRSGAASKQSAFERVPPVLVVHLKRFAYDEQGRPFKLDKHVRFPPTLELDKRLFSHRLVAAHRYALFAVVSHFGERLTSGHYVADAAHRGQWLTFDDDKVYQCSKKTVLSRPAYLLFYSALS